MPPGQGERVERLGDPSADGAEIRPVEVGRDHRDALAVGPADLRRPLDFLDRGHRGQRDRRLARLEDGQSLQVLDAVAEALGATDADVDAAVLALEVGGDRSLHLGPYRLGGVGQREAEARQPLAVEADLQLGVAALGGRLHVGEARNLAHQSGQSVAEPLDQQQVVATQLDLHRCAEAEVARPAETVIEIALGARATCRSRAIIASSRSREIGGSSPRLI